MDSAGVIDAVRLQVNGSHLEQEKTSAATTGSDCCSLMWEAARTPEKAAALMFFVQRVVQRYEVSGAGANATASGYKKRRFSKSPSWQKPSARRVRRSVSFPSALGINDGAGRDVSKYSKACSRRRGRTPLDEIDFAVQVEGQLGSAMIDVVAGRESLQPSASRFVRIRNGSDSLPPGLWWW